ncbi:aspartic peptidase domain-containing protein [Favolaschia claudopus]|uniref:Aspartic peptidase domain-containing protein n=1 Tax=Favolaschia claudopus TaxID=2862362 RepID=A0AAW0BJ15_9AGAR
MVSGCNQGCSVSSADAVFNYTKSLSARNKSTSTQTIQFSESFVTGSVFTDIIQLGSFAVSDASFCACSFLGLPPTPVVTPQVGFFGDSAGVFGLGFPSASFQNLPSIWQSVLSSNTVDAPEMGIWLSRVHNTSTSTPVSTPGVFTLGGTNSLFYTGDIEFLDSTSTSAWALSITTITIQGHVLTLTPSLNNVAFDPTTVIYGPSSFVATIWAQVPGASLLMNSDPDTIHGPDEYQYPCSTTLNVSVSFGGRLWTLDPAELNLGTIPDGNNTQCWGAIIGSDDQSGWIFGKTFLRGVYTVLRQGDTPSIGFADLSEQAGGGSSPSPTSHSTASSGSASSPPSSTPPSDSAKKSAVDAVVGGVIGALVLCAALLTTLLLTRRRRQQNRPDKGGVNRDLAPEPFVAVDQRLEMAPLNSAQRRFRRKLQENGPSLNHPHRNDAGSDSVNQPSESVGEGENGASSPPAAAAADVSVMEELRNLREEMRRLAERDPRDSIAPPSYHPEA